MVVCVPLGARCATTKLGAHGRRENSDQVPVQKCGRVQGPAPQTLGPAEASGPRGRCMRWALAPQGALPGALWSPTLGLAEQAGAEHAGEAVKVR